MIRKLKIELFEQKIALLKEEQAMEEEAFEWERHHLSRGFFSYPPLGRAVTASQRRGSS
jgi:hypothetical protein